MWNHFLVEYLFFPALLILPWSLFLEMLVCRAEPPPKPFKDWGGGTLVPLPEERDFVAGRKKQWLWRAMAMIKI